MGGSFSIESEVGVGTTGDYHFPAHLQKTALPLSARKTSKPYNCYVNYTFRQRLYGARHRPQKGEEKIVVLTAYILLLFRNLDPHVDILLVGDHHGALRNGEYAACVAE
ncbi:MAG: hypothetical protein U1E36_08730 [Rickettsiales bacterium]